MKLSILRNNDAMLIPKKRPFLWIVILMQIAIFSVSIFVCDYFYKNYAKEIREWKSKSEEIVAKSTKNSFAGQLPIVFYDKNNKIIAVKNQKAKPWIEYEDIPKTAIDIVIATEDRNFYDHDGIDPKGIIRAAIENYRSKDESQGASTVTQQVVKNAFFTQEKSYERKIREIYAAVAMEKKYTKKEIMEFYINSIYFGHGYYGLHSASLGYFGKEPNELSLSEITVLLAMPNNPSLYDPYRFPDKLKAREERILTALVATGNITENDKREALKEDVVFKDNNDIKNTVSSYLWIETVKTIMQSDGFQFQTVFKTETDYTKYKKNYDECYNRAEKKLERGGYRVFTSIDTDIQNTLQKSLDDNLSEFKSKTKDGIYKMQGAAVCINNDTGLVVALIGGRSQKNVDPATAINRAFQSYRQPGSTIKPVLVYTPAIGELGYKAETLVNDHYIPDGPKNANGHYRGDMSLREAVTWSTNTIAWQLYQELTPQKGITYLKKMGFSNLDPSDSNNLSPALGGFTHGVSPLEMAKAYATIANKGTYREPTAIMNITDYDGKLIWEYSNDTYKTRVYKKKACIEMTDILNTAITEGTGKSASITSQPCAGKTGTTNDRKDGWFCGYTPYYTCSVWCGYDQPKYIEGMSGGAWPAAIWHDFMENINSKKPYREFFTKAPQETKDKKIKVEKKKEKSKENEYTLPGNSVEWEDSEVGTGSSSVSVD